MKVNIITIAYNLPEGTQKLVETALLDADKHDISFQLFLHSKHQATVEMCNSLHQKYPVIYYPYGENRGLANSWNEGIIAAFAEMNGIDVLILANDDVYFAAGDIDKIAKRAMEKQDNYMISCSGFNRAHGKVIPSLGYSCFALNPIAYERIGMFDQNFFPIYCVAPETPILTADLRWIPIGDAQSGLRLVGVDEENDGGRYRRYRPSTVTAVGRRKAPALRIIFEDGREVICSHEHRWLGRSPRRVEKQHWIFAGDLREGFRIVAPLKPWETEMSYDAGWLAGLYDGEGSLHISSKDTGTRAVTLSQKAGPVMDRAKQILDDLGIVYTGDYPANGGVKVVDINTRSRMFEFLGRVRPVRLLQERAWDGSAMKSKNIDPFAVIARIENAGERDLIDISTTTRTFIANGLVSHNCEDQDHHRRAHLMGMREENCADTQCYHGGSSAINKDPMLGRQNVITQGKNRRYLFAKWGSETLEGGYKTPFNNPKFNNYISPEVRHNPYGEGYDRTDKGIVRF